MAGAIFAVALIAAAFFFTKKKWPEIQASKAGIATAKQVSSTRETIIDRKGILQVEHARLVGTLPVFPLRKDPATELYKQIDKMAKDTGVNILKIEAEEEEEEKTGGVYQMRIGCNYSAKGDDIVRFLFLTQTKGGALDVSQYSHKPKRNAEGVVEGRFIMDCAYRRKDIVEGTPIGTPAASAPSTPARIMPNPSRPTNAGATSGAGPRTTAPVPIAMPTRVKTGSVVSGPATTSPRPSSPSSSIRPVSRPGGSGSIRPGTTVPGTSSGVPRLPVPANLPGPKGSLPTMPTLPASTTRSPGAPSISPTIPRLPTRTQRTERTPGAFGTTPRGPSLPGAGTQSPQSIPVPRLPTLPNR